MAKSSKQKKEVVSLFTGAGGLDYGFARQGFETVLAADNCNSSIATFNDNAGKNIALNLDLATVATDAFLKLIPRGAEPIGLIGGPPCQGFSRGNVFANVDDPRNTLPFQYAKLLKAMNEKYRLHFFVFENVADLAGPKYSKRFSRILLRLEDAGFNIFHSILDASDYEVPQRRKRLFIVGLNRKRYPSVEFKFPIGNGKTKTVADTIKGLPQPQFFVRGLASDNIPYHPNHWTMMPKSPKLRTGVSNGRSFRRLDWNKVSPTVAYGNREIHVHPDGGRRLSVFEAMLLQGFPRTYRLSGTLSAQITQVSNAVPPPLAKAIAKQINEILEIKRSTV